MIFTLQLNNKNIIRYLLKLHFYQCFHKIIPTFTTLKLNFNGVYVHFYWSLSTLQNDWCEQKTYSGSKINGMLFQIKMVYGEEVQSLMQLHSWMAGKELFCSWKPSWHRKQRALSVQLGKRLPRKERNEKVSNP